MTDKMQTTPKGEEIPVPTRKDWTRALDKVAQPKDSPKDGPPEE